MSEEQALVARLVAARMKAPAAKAWQFCMGDCDHECRLLCCNSRIGKDAPGEAPRG